MDLHFLSRNAESAHRSKSIQRQRGVTFSGAKIWDDAEVEILRATADLTIPEVQKLLPHRTVDAIDHHREKLRIRRRALKPWTTTEDRILKHNIDAHGYVEIAKLLPGRNAHSVQGRAWYLGVRKGVLRKAKPKGLPIYDEVRDRAFEDGLSLRALDAELRTGKYFQDNWQKKLNWKKLARAVEFFGGTMKIDWQDV